MRKRYLCTLELPAAGTVPSSTFQEEGRNTKEAKRAAAEVALRWLKEQPGYQSGRPGEEDVWTVIARACSAEVRRAAMQFAAPELGLARPAGADHGPCWLRSHMSGHLDSF